MKTLAIALLLVGVVGVTGCKGKGASAGNSLGKLAEFRDAMCKCKDTACAQDVSAKMTAWTQEQAKGQQPAKLSDADQAKSQQISDDLGKCMAAAMTAANPAGSAAAGSAAAGSAAGSDAIDPAAFADLPQECLDYRKAVDRLRTCDKLPADVRDTMLQQFDHSAQGWAKLPAESKKSLKEPCAAGIKAVMANSKDCGP
ncbi:MAG TPA: hypothetical protein VL326_11985 [Kofleriaceae bacterium]|jgi:hypothetical protein|nr:hypothetical protein [Kofleriaceae bacterium]